MGAKYIAEYPPQCEETLPSACKQASTSAWILEHNRILYNIHIVIFIKKSEKISICFIGKCEMRV